MGTFLRANDKKHYKTNTTEIAKKPIYTDPSRVLILSRAPNILYTWSYKDF